MVVRAARAALATGVVALVLLGLAGCDASSGPTAATPSTPRSVAGPSATATAAESAFRPTGPTRTAKVVRVVDGDTIVVRLDGRDERLRYIGMDTPETKKQDTPVEWMGPEATAANEALVGGRTVVLEKDVSETDRFGRLLRYVWLVDGERWTLVDLELVRRGFAQVETDPPDVKYADRFVAAQGAARAAGIGLWGPGPSGVP
jgi:micrococcal nuclease